MEVLRNVSLVYLKDPVLFWGMIAPHGEELCGDLALMVAENFSYKAEFPFGYFIPE